MSLLAILIVELRSQLLLSRLFALLKCYLEANCLKILVLRLVSFKVVCESRESLNCVVHDWWSALILLKSNLLAKVNSL